MSPRSPSAGYFGSPSRAKLTLDEVPWKRKRWMVSTRSLGSSRGSTSSRKVRRGSSALTTVLAWYSVPSSRATPIARPFLVMTSLTGDSSDDLGPERLRRAGEDLGEPAVAALVEGPRPELAVVLADRVVEQDQPRALRARPDLGPDDRRRGEVALDDVRLEVVVEEVGGAPGQQPDRVVQRPLVHLPEPLTERWPARAAPRGRR